MNVQQILESLDLGEQERVQAELVLYNKENSECFFFSTEEREKRKWQLDEFKRMKYRDYEPQSDSDCELDYLDDSEVKLRQKLSQALIKFLAVDLQPSCQLICLETIRILSRDRHAVGPLSTEEAISTLAGYAGINSKTEYASPEKEQSSASTLKFNLRDAEINSEAVKAICNIVYNSLAAQDHAANLRLLSGLAVRVKLSTETGVSPRGLFYDLRLMFLLTALRPELRVQLAKEDRGIALLTDLLENTLKPRWADIFEVLTDKAAPPLSHDVSERAMEILKILFNITFNINKGVVDEEDAALYRHLAAILRHCLLIQCEEEDRTEELQGHAVNLLANLPLGCLDVLLAARVGHDTVEYLDINMDCVVALLGFLNRRLDRAQKLKERVTPVLNLLTESARVHRETRKFLRMKILPPLRDVHTRPEVGSTLRNKLVRLMTHVDTDVKQCAAELLFVLCKENVSRFVKYTGYGNAAGLLAARGLLAGGRGEGVYSDEEEDTDTEEYLESRNRINPVTGRVEMPQPNPMEGMTEEQKEMEALKLVNMFDRLSREQIIEPFGVTVDGRLARLKDTMTDNAVQELEDKEDEEEEEDPQAKLEHSESPCEL
ncbi:synembryn-A-like isoform X2 [Erpetoichthys calabaricus]|uniref:synembryn-A-like isoform X2 n=1 Tax=Erpetoichthys calabaricus TaxID=27687 RepID=UPI0022341773|nr:synembryn-A-like isoform X2 [Erpetoichthys calabaricus]